MKTPVLLLGASAIFWGWQTELCIFALPMALILEGSRFIRWRWDLSAQEFRSIANICIIIFFFVFVYLLLEHRSIYLVYNLLEWLPCVFFPLVAAQAYSTSDYIDIRTLFLFLSKFSYKQENSTSLQVNLTYPYFALCILSSGTANTKVISFYSGMFVLCALALWFVRSKRFSPIVWLCLILMAGGIGFIGQIGLHQLHLTFEERVVEWLANAHGQKIDSLNQHTSIGEIGLLKMSNEIFFRVASVTRLTSPLLLREATYNKYQSSSWIASNSNFVPILPDNNGTTWRLGSKPANSSTIFISTTLNDGKGLLKLADGTFQIDQLPVSHMEKNQYGTVNVVGKFDALAYQVQFNQSLSLDKPPTENDLHIANQERPALNQILSQLNIQGKSPQEILPRVESFFQKNYSYSLKLAGKGEFSTPLSTFLLQTHSGHCEYFATATTLLLRALGIPARYAVGYSVHEFSPLENQYIVRGRHAHAWTLAYVGGKWQAFDTTPADWTSTEDATANKWTFISDLWSLLGFKLSGWWRYIKGSNLVEYVWWLILPLFFILMRFSGGNNWVRRISIKQILPKPITKSVSIKTNSDFSLIEQALNNLGLSRHPSESLKNWVERLKKELPTSNLIEELTSLIELYYRDRFDPEGLKEIERARLKSAVKLWLDKYNNS